MTTALRQRRGYQKVGAEFSARCYDAYKKSWGTITFDGGAKGAFAAIVAAMSYNSQGEAASAQMLGIHAALGTLWFALVIKDYAYAGSTYLKKDKEELEEIGKRVLLYAKLKLDPTCARDASNLQSPLDSTEVVNRKLINAINHGLIRENFPPLDEEATIAQIKDLATQRSKIGKPHVLAAIGAAAGTLTLAGTATIAAAKATGSAEALAAGVSITAVAGATTAITGAALSASARNSKKFIRTISSAIGSLIDNEFGHVGKTVMDKKKSEIEEEIRSGTINPLRTLQPIERRTALTPASAAAASNAVPLSPINRQPQTV